ncbi:hypothetical protein, partial [Streptomyces sp. NPDC059994]|uniref:hypothetical protein n=1 Tax=Streptomyces sp. NPDC059994 TaxID=3347029 RepID=UPI0036AF2A97
SAARRPVRLVRGRRARREAAPGEQGAAAGRCPPRHPGGPDRRPASAARRPVRLVRGRRARREAALGEQGAAAGRCPVGQRP